MQHSEIGYQNKVMTLLNNQYAPISIVDVSSSAPKIDDKTRLCQQKDIVDVIRHDPVDNPVDPEELIYQ